MIFAVLFFLFSGLIEGLLAFGYYSDTDNTSGGGSNKLLLILVDGCRWDYPDQDVVGLPGFRKLAENGVRAPYVTPIFPSNSYPNWYTIVTGLYAENHGFVQNMMYDSLYGDFFLMGPNDTASVPHWWESAEPLWITAEKNGLRSALYWWDGCQVEIKGKKPTYCRKYKYVGSSWPTVNEDTKDALLTALQLLENNEIQLVQMYYEPVDFSGHKYGPNSFERKQSVKDIDNLLDLLQREMSKRGLDNTVNLVVLSDHGMTSTDSRGLNVINLQEMIDISDIKYMVYYGATSMLLPYEGKTEKVHEALKGITGLHVYLKEEIPEHYHIKNSRLTLPILLVASKNYYIKGLDIPGKNIPTGSSISRGSHGYDPYEVPDMRGIFFARGPALKKNYISQPLQMVDIYNILCELLNIEPLPNNGTKTVSKGIAALPYSSANHISILPIKLYISFIIWSTIYYKYQAYIT
ncbi:glycerophosphocholine cholinephosphodiesterase ENPP6-like [Parasteatoda tepidariorum]|uniref:glycerophosphocholine cholinephosphodiesterase ENPP6-like n=1 Tax=Parasteatoda tepidariorum TaxID=114398 RepID=UPI000A2C0CA5|nr:glycerophosphocholine cholinephosphodiesterase ENPP6-like [Parasteatoda tepidariorum]